MRCANVNIADSGVLVIVGLEREQVSLQEAGLLTRLSSEGGEGRRWQWRPFTPMDGERCSQLLAVYFTEGVYIVDFDISRHSKDKHRVSSTSLFSLTGKALRTSDDSRRDTA
ncbi:unnamed protein product [Hymenolepis diminuta]|uniref:Uncharacterized protein n=1 Tax=Hymenolepis diminuta TaxID=6216 RepID=A0A564YLJ0_HYMDI|nr:unnamed protein product [Hymenolepis diminuta]